MQPQLKNSQDYSKKEEEGKRLAEEAVDKLKKEEGKLLKASKDGEEVVIKMQNDQVSVLVDLQSQLLIFKCHFLE